MPPPPGEGEAALARVWDVPTRVIHWSLVALLPVLWWTAEEGRMDWHRWAGLALLGLLAFRLLWGVIGASTARFSAFLRGPVTVWRYARSLFGGADAPAFHGHNPMGGWSVAAMLALLMLQVGLGLCATDIDGLESGPLAVHLTFDQARAAADWHDTVFDLLLIVIGLHVAAVAAYLLLRRENLVWPMVRGVGLTASPARPAPLWRALLAAVIAVGVMIWVSKGAPLP
jgi:cytochrome b